MSAAIVAGVDASPVFEPAEHVFDSLALAIEQGMLGIGIFRFFLDGMHG